MCNQKRKYMSETLSKTQKLREKAISWWKTLPNRDKYMDDYFSEREESSLTGREIQSIYEAEHPQDCVLETPKNYVGVRFITCLGNIYEIHNQDESYVYYINKKQTHPITITLKFFEENIADGTWVILEEHNSEILQKESSDISPIDPKQTIEEAAKIALKRTEPMADETSEFASNYMNGFEDGAIWKEEQCKEEVSKLYSKLEYAMKGYPQHEKELSETQIKLLQKILESIEKSHAELLSALKDLRGKMKRARSILNREDGISNWGMLDTSEYDSLVEKANELTSK